MTTANNPVVTAELLRETLGRVIDVLDDAGGFSDVPAVREAKRVYIMSRAMTQASPPPDEMVAVFAEAIHGAMVHAVNEFKGKPEPWQNGNSTAESYARQVARAALQSIGPMRGWEG